MFSKEAEELISNLLVLDIETTGTDKSADSIIEIAAFNLTPGNDSIPLIKGDFLYNKCCKLDQNAAFRMYLEPIVFEMHAKSGLAKDSRSSNDSEGQMISDFLAELTKFAQDKKIILVGNSVHFDKGFLEKRSPKFEDIFSHRILDVSSVGRFLKLCDFEIESKDKRHRALLDCEDCLESLNQMILQYGVGTIV